MNFYPAPIQPFRRFCQNCREDKADYLFEHDSSYDLETNMPPRRIFFYVPETFFIYQSENFCRDCFRYLLMARFRYDGARNKNESFFGNACVPVPCFLKRPPTEEDYENAFYSNNKRIKFS